MSETGGHDDRAEPDREARSLCCPGTALSGYYMAIEMRNLSDSLDTIVDVGDWQPVRRASPQVMAAWLAQQAKRLDRARYRETGRTHFSAARTLQQRKAKAP